jgi:hypothetical protein
MWPVNLVDLKSTVPSKLNHHVHVDGCGMVGVSRVYRDCSDLPKKWYQPQAVLVHYHFSLFLQITVEPQNTALDGFIDNHFDPRTIQLHFFWCCNYSEYGSGHFQSQKDTPPPLRRSMTVKMSVLFKGHLSVMDNSGAHHSEPVTH